MAFNNKEEERYELLFADLNSLGLPYTVRCEAWDGFAYRHSVTAKIKPSKSPTDSAVIELWVDKHFQALSDVAILRELNYKQTHPTSSKWTKVMLGKPSSSALANHTLAGIKFAADFKSNMGFRVQAESNQVQKAMDAIQNKHNTWGMPSTGDLRFLNT
jgi:hypothetical protein